MSDWGWLCCAALLQCLSSGAYAQGAANGLATTQDSFCSSAQQFVASTALAARNVVYADYETFVRKRPEIEPLETQQYVLYEDDRRTLPLRISCKMHTPDRIESAWGEKSARDEPHVCADLHREIVRQAYAALDPAERQHVRRAPDQIMIDADQRTFLNSSWIAPFDFAYVDGEGSLHLRAKALRIGWDDILWSWAPDSMRGNFYCHVAAPEYVRRVMMGVVVGLPGMAATALPAGRGAR